MNFNFLPIRISIGRVDVFLEILSDSPDIWFHKYLWIVVAADAALFVDIFSFRKEIKSNSGLFNLFLTLSFPPFSEYTQAMFWYFISIFPRGQGPLCSKYYDNFN